MKIVFTIFILITAISNKAVAQVFFVPIPATTNTNISLHHISHFHNKFDQEPNLTELSQTYNLLYIALLDPRYSELIFEYDPNLRGIYNNYKQTIDSELNSIEIKTDASEISQFFESQSKFKAFLKLIYKEDSHCISLTSYKGIIDTSRAIIQLTDNNFSCTTTLHLSLNAGELIVTHLSDPLDFTQSREAYEYITRPRLGLKFGGGIGTLGIRFKDLDTGKNIEDLHYNLKSRFCYKFGLTYDIPISKREQIYLQPGLIYSSEGGVEKSPGENLKLNLNYIKVPLNLLMKLGNPKKATFDLYWGIFFSYGIGGSCILDSSPTKLKVFGDGNNSLDLYRFNGGVILGCGATIKGFRIGLDLESGMGNIAAKSKLVSPVENTKLTMNNCIISLEIGYNFDLRKKK